MQHETIPRHLNFNTLNPEINLEAIPARIPLENIEWKIVEGKPRIAGVSSFGITGTDAHLIMEEPPVILPSSKLPSDSRPLHLLTISAKSEDTLKRRRDRALSLDNMKLLFIIFFSCNFFGFVSCCVENGIVAWRARKAEILLLARKISGISTDTPPAGTPALLITDAQSDGKSNFDSHSDIHEQNGKIEDKMDRLQPPHDPDAIVRFEDDQKEE